MHEKYGAHGTRTNEEKRHDASWGRSQAHRGLRADAEAQERRRADPWREETEKLHLLGVHVPECMDSMNTCACTCNMHMYMHMYM